MSAPFTILSLQRPEDIACHPAPLLPDFDPETVARHRADAHLIAIQQDGTVAARASLWWQETPSLNGAGIGCIGHFAATDSVAARAVLDAGCSQLALQGCSTAIGPLDGNTWRRYRFITERGNEKPFLMEPDNPDEWPAFWNEAGFAVAATYFSALNSDLDYEDPQVTRAGERLRTSGINLRTIDMNRYEEELQAIHHLSLEAFAENFLYTPLSEREFLAQYDAVRSRVRPELVLLAERDGQLAGYVFCVPDWLRGPQTDTVVLKTVAIRQDRRMAGLGTWLVAEAQIAARNLGYKRVIHALMHESNISLHLSARYAKPFRRYALFQRVP